MIKLVSTLSIAITLVVAGCASAPSGGSSSGTPAASAPAPVERLAPAVSVPAASARNVVLTMTGPKTVVDSKDWGEFQREWRETFAEHAKAAGVTFRFVDSAPAASAEEGTLLLVNVDDYRIVGIGARIMFGIMTGNAFIDAQVRFLNLRDGAKFGEQSYKTTSSAASGIFAKVTPQQVDAIASNVFLDLKSAK